MDRALKIAAFTILAIAITWIGNFIHRESTLLLFSLYSAAFLAFYHLYKTTSSAGTLLKFSFLLRMLLLFSIPALSNDFYRFIWDGRMSVLGFNPFMVLPLDFAESGQMDQVGRDAWKLYNGQGSLSPGNFTCYPPLNQFLFILPAWLFPENIFINVVIIRLMLIMADLGTIHYAQKILRKLGLPAKNILLYALNPFIIIELTGNLHFEGVMIFFLVLSLYYLMQHKQLQSALVFTLSVSVKLIPLLFLPLFLKKTGQRRLILYSLIVFAGTLVLFLPFVSQGFVTNFMSSIDLYFRKFEFNASFYYLVRWVGYQHYGWNIIQKAGPMLGLMVFILVLKLAVIPDNRKTEILLSSMLIAITFYYFFATTVHPWYISLPLVLSVFTHFRFPVLWSFVIIMSYSAYADPDFNEHLWIIAIEYIVVYSFFGYEMILYLRRKLAPSRETKTR